MLNLLRSEQLLFSQDGVEASDVVIEQAAAKERLPVVAKEAAAAVVDEGVVEPMVEAGRGAFSV